jgi:hypothetical protein
VRGFLLDSNVTSALVSSVRRVAPTCEIVHLADWRGGGFLHARDAEIIEKAREDDLILVTHDVATIPRLVRRWIIEGRSLAGVAVITTHPGRGADIGGLARALGDLYDHAERLDPSYPVVYLQPLR